MKYNYLLVEIEDDIAYVSLNNISANNELETGMAKELLVLAKELSMNENIKIIVLGARGDNFSIGVPRSEAGDFEEEYSPVALAGSVIEEWARLPYPIMAAVNGRCESLGFSLACIADIRYAGENAVFSVPEATWGMVPAGGITNRLPRLIGKGPAMMMLLGAEPISADRALELGLVVKVTDEEALWDEVCNEAKRLANLSTLSMQYTKECLIRGSELPLEQALRLELDVYMLLQTSEDRMEGVNAFLQKRSPQFKGS